MAAQMDDRVADQNCKHINYLNQIVKFRCDGKFLSIYTTFQGSKGGSGHSDSTVCSHRSDASLITFRRHAFQNMNFFQPTDCTSLAFYMLLTHDPSIQKMIHHFPIGPIMLPDKF